MEKLREIVRNEPIICGWIEEGQIVGPGEAYLIEDGSIWHTDCFKSSAGPMRGEKIILKYTCELPEDEDKYIAEQRLREVETRESIVPLERIASQLTPELTFKMYNAILKLIKAEDSNGEIYVNETYYRHPIKSYVLDHIIAHHRGESTEDYIPRVLADELLVELESIAMYLRETFGDEDENGEPIGVLCAFDLYIAIKEFFEKKDAGAGEIHNLAQKYALSEESSS